VLGHVELRQQGRCARVYGGGWVVQSTGGGRAVREGRSTNVQANR
jgi:hypothetical protein